MRVYTLLVLAVCGVAAARKPGFQIAPAPQSGRKDVPALAYPAGTSQRIPSGPTLAAAQRAQHSLSAGVDCATCTALATLAQDIAENATELADIVDALDVVCKALSPTDNTTYALCAAVAKDAINILPWVNTQLSTLAWDIPLGFCSVFVPVCQNPCCNTTTIPEQLHIALTNDLSEMSVTWVTLQNTNTSTVQWGPGNNATGVFPHSAKGWTKTYTDGGWVGVLHVAVMTNLTPATTYSYRVGDANGGWSKVFTFSTFARNIGSTEVPFRIAQIGDEAYDNNSDVTVATMTQLVANGQLDMVLHIGDISYADGFQPHWDIFFRKVEEIAARVPYMVVPGNHEFWFNFSAYKHRFAMPYYNTTDSTYYSFTAGNAHFVMFDTETWIDTADVDPAQVNWLTADLIAANENRAAVPWIIAGGHRPLYCSNNDKTQCGLFAEILRYQVEDLYFSNNVNLVMGAHEHGYERMYPVYNNTVLSTNYTNPPSPIYIVNGAAGNREGNSRPIGNDPWSAFQDADIGYAVFVISGAHALEYTFYAANGTTVDSFTITK